ncbi:alpha/beta hydrolase [Pseudoxanthomonas sacheonensis]|uniref:Pimeloyl-ACP methyl ester carboxylesterase n=1 Tax=Pseudoxanthomonas sacheonensis TaxID=443615 RepID=A0ABU1RSP3_9GAMM|nr:alpha/beta hydrolase [Pseudoxanthomonas sacheonensis]MDR6841807.1 pimeloyl-ACP methyl ester carboxylesterase [Pseudoxanthomonas sacheonensis]
MRRILIAAALLTLACAANAQNRKLGSLEFKTCSLSTPFSGDALAAQCATLQVPENPAAPNGRKIGLKIAWIPADKDDAAEPDPVFMLAGGPGQSALESYPSTAGAFAETRKKRHLILVDQRGTGASNALTCKEPFDETQLPTPQAASDYTKRCLVSLSKRADPRFYTTSEAIQDLDAVRKAIGAAQINLVGISYGTRVAQQYAAKYPASTRTLVLDSVAPNSLVLGNEFSRNLEDALDLQFALCAKTPACVRRMGNPREKLRALMAKLETDPPLVTYRDGITGESKQEKLTPALVAGLVRMYAYMPLASSLLPLQLNEAANGRYDALMALSKMLGDQMADSITLGMQLSVICSEDGGELKANPADEGTLLGNDFSRYLAAQCAVWPKGTRPAGFRAPLKTKVPALLLSGEFDPVTPPRYGDAVVKSLPNGRHLVLRGQGHNVIGIGCMPKLMGQFIDTADAGKLDAKCLAKLAYTPPFTGFYGWEP